MYSTDGLDDVASCNL